MIEINDNVVFVKGKKRSAIYEFNTGKVYSINDIGTNIITHYANMDNICEVESVKFLDNLERLNLISEKWTPKIYVPEKKPVELSTVWLEITQKCNLRCLHCYEGETHCQQKNPLTLNDWEKIVDELYLLNVNRIIVIGGEPTASEFLEDLIDYLVKFNFDITLFSNVTYISEKMFKLIVENNIKVKFSIYGHNAKVHDCITQVKGSFEHTVCNVKKLVEAGVKVNAAVVAMKENQDYMDDIREFVKSIGVKYSRYDVIRNVFNGQQSKHTPDRRDIVKNVMKSKSFVTDKEKFDSYCYVNSCWCGKIAIMEDGSVIPCVFARDQICGNIRDFNSLNDLLNSERLLKYWYYNIDNINECKICEYRYACKDCRPLGYSCNGDISEKNPRCKYNPNFGVWDNE